MRGRPALTKSIERGVSVALAICMLGGCAARSIRAEVDIAAPPAIVWAVLTDLARYPEWNPFTPRIDGALRVGERLVLHVQLRPGHTLRQQWQRVTRLDAPRTLGWQTQLLSRRELFASRLQQLTPRADGGTHYATTDTLRGSFVPLVMSVYEKDLTRGFVAMVTALKARAEQRAKQPRPPL